MKIQTHMVLNTNPILHEVIPPLVLAIYGPWTEDWTVDWAVMPTEILPPPSWCYTRCTETWLVAELTKYWVRFSVVSIIKELFCLLTLELKSSLSYLKYFTPQSSQWSSPHTKFKTVMQLISFYKKRAHEQSLKEDIVHSTSPHQGCMYSICSCHRYYSSIGAITYIYAPACSTDRSHVRNFNWSVHNLHPIHLNWPPLPTCKVKLFCRLIELQPSLGTSSLA